MRSEVAISLKNVEKTYRLFNHPGDRIKQFITFGVKKYHRSFNALSDVSLEIAKGEAVGIIGRNGSGKSTLLQLICGILKPTSGSVQTHGRISALLELGAGFNPEFTGRENVYFQGALLGFAKSEMDARIGEIAQFADIGEFLDEPVRTYSSGMFVRLAFAAMIHVDADILVIDEALAVGDEEFQRRCFNRLIEYLNGSGKILLLVSHNVRQVERMCSRVIWLEGGRVAKDGNALEVCSGYHAAMHHKAKDGAREAANLSATFANSGEVDITGIELFSNESNTPVDEILMHSSLRIVVDFECHSLLESVDVVVGFHTTDVVYISAASTAEQSLRPSFSPGKHRVEVSLVNLMLLPGVYQIRLGILDKNLRPIWAGNKLSTFRVAAPMSSQILRLPPGLVEMPFEWRFPSIEPHGSTQKASSV